MLPRLKQLRLESRLRQKDIARLLGVNLATYKPLRMWRAQHSLGQPQLNS